LNETKFQEEIDWLSDVLDALPSPPIIPGSANSVFHLMTSEQYAQSSTAKILRILRHKHLIVVGRQHKNYTFEAGMNAIGALPQYSIFHGKFPHMVY
jgi:hypothetical protein